jgi:hypothetical protein
MLHRQEVAVLVQPCAEARGMKTHQRQQRERRRLPADRVLAEQLAEPHGFQADVLANGILG